MGLPTLRKSKSVLRSALKLYRRKKSKLSESTIEELRDALNALQNEILKKDREKAADLALHVKELASVHLKKNVFDYLRDLFTGLILALFVAILIRQLWFEFYEIPTGSMRPTFEEKDRVVVSKTTFGINIPFNTGHFYFDESLTKRSGIFIFTGRDMDIRDVDTLYFWIFPGKKQFVKRMMGKPGDTLYFYGGQIYGIDRDGNDISDKLQPHSLKYVDHVPFISFEGKALTPRTQYGGIHSPVILHQMNEPVARLSLSSQNRIDGEMLSPYDSVPTYGDLWGFKNYAMARLVTEGDQIFLELTHDPNFENAKLEKDIYGRLRPVLGTFKSRLPVDETALKHIQEHLYTARFIVKNGHAYRYGSTPTPLYAPKMSGIPDGTYEIIDGTIYKIHWQGVRTKVAQDHALHQADTPLLITLFNLGIEFDTRFDSSLIHPSRFSYFKEGDLYVMGGKIFDKTDRALQTFVAEEKKLVSESTPRAPYFPFIDHGAPKDAAFIKQYGVKIPEKTYLALGDNYAMSSDSRDFGFVPQGNLRGSPTFIFWPPGSRFGRPPQSNYIYFNVGCIVIWILAGIGFIFWQRHHRKHHRLPLEIN